MTKKQTELSEELREAVFEAARAAAAEAYTQNTGYVNYFKAMETLLYNYKKLAALVADEEAYCEVEYHAGRKTFSTTPQAKGFIQRKTEAEIVEEMREEKQKQFKETKSGFDSLTRAISLFEGHKDKAFCVNARKAFSFTLLHRLFHRKEDNRMKPWAERFYNSDAWRSCRDSFLKSKGYLCERCSTPDDPVTAKIAHHKTYLT